MLPRSGIDYHLRVCRQRLDRPLWSSMMRRATIPCTALSLLFALLACCTLMAQTPIPADAPYKNADLPVEKRVADLLNRMTLEEKVTMLAGSGWMESMPIARLGIPAIKMADGPMGVRSWTGSSAITSAANRTGQGAQPPLSRRASPWPPPGTPTWCSAKARPSARKSKRSAAT